MARSKESKQAIIKSLSEKINEARSLVFVSLQGLTVKESEELRKNLRKESIDCMMAKKTLIRHSLEQSGIAGINPKHFEGEVAVVCSYDDEVAPARISCAFAKTHEALRILGGIIMQKDAIPILIDETGMKRLAALPSQQELRAKMIGSISSPLQGFASVLSGTIRSIVRVLDALQNAKNENIQS